jgi:small subunit ribosomal protein S6
MRKYETFFIIDPDLPDEVNTVIDEKIKAVVASNGGSVLSYVPWGKKKLAYTVKKRTRGHYVLMEYAGGPQLVAELERNMRLDERVLKFITVLLDERFDPAKEEARKAAAAKAASIEEERTTGKTVSAEGDEDEVSAEGIEEGAEESEGADR